MNILHRLGFFCLLKQECKLLKEALNVLLCLLQVKMILKGYQGACRLMELLIRARKDKKSLITQEDMEYIMNVYGLLRLNSTADRNDLKKRRDIYNSSIKKPSLSPRPDPTKPDQLQQPQPSQDKTSPPPKSIKDLTVDEICNRFSALLSHRLTLQCPMNDANVMRRSAVRFRHEAPLKLGGKGMSSMQDRWHTNT
ncbi:hypothetical protein CSUB01_09959 [Colletotrichum sublineola]|uniref:Uncharacterized protein n=1 Tax=Colletotrichum sublineola TaxID=1173701 RepID=A0A066XIP4_COLSU|nr:hypothetical protein CSUB01_09959 [Colletotrichum sublineola]